MKYLIRIVLFLVNFFVASCGSGKHSKTDLPSTPDPDPTFCDLHATDTPFAGGDGTSGSPYLICSASQFANIASNLNSDFKLIRSIDFSGVTGFAPLSSGVSPFTGTLDGNGYVLSNLTITTAASSALFGSIQGGDVRNIGLVNITINGSGSCAAIASLLGSSSLIYNSYSTGTITCSAGTAGGLAATLSASTIESSYSLAQVSASAITGGLVGNMQASSIVRKSYFAGTAQTSTAQHVGGIAGMIMGAGAILEQSYSTGNVTAAGLNAGGIAGTLGSTAILRDCWSSGTIKGQNVVGGIVGWTNSGTPAIQRVFSIATLERSSGAVGTQFGTIIADPDFGTVSSSLEYSDVTLINLAGVTLTDSGMPQTSSSALTNQATYSGWDFTTVWKMGGTSGYAVLNWQP